LCFIVAPIAYVALRQYSVIVSTPPGRYAVHWGVSLKQDHERYVVTLMQNIQHFQLVWMVFVGLFIAGSWYSANLVYHRDGDWPACFIPAVIWMIVSCIFIIGIRRGIEDMKKFPSDSPGIILIIFLAGLIVWLAVVGTIQLIIFNYGDSRVDGLYYEMKIAQLLMVHNVIIFQLLAPTAIWLGIIK